MFRKSFVVALLCALVSAACSDSSSRRAAPTLTSLDLTTVNFEVLHASQDAPPVNVTIGASQAFSGVGYGSAGFVSTTAGGVDVQVDGILPGGPAPVIGPTTLDTVDGQRVSILAVGPVASIEPLVLVDDQPAVDAAEVRVRVVHAASTAPMVDVYVTAPTADITMEAPLGTFEFKGTLGPVTVPEGDYRIQVTIAGDPTTVAYDSGTVGLAGGSDLLVAAIPNVATGAAAVELVALTGSGALRLLDANSTADVRVIHASPDAPNVDVVAADNFAAPAVTNLAFPEVTGYLNLTPGDLNVKVVPTGAMMPVVIDADLSLAAATAYSVLAVGDLATIAPLVLVDDIRPVGTEARVRIVHASPSAGDVDLYVVAPGTDISTVTPNFTGVAFTADTGYVSLAAGDYDVVVTPTGDTTPAIGPVTISVAAGGIYTAAARDESGGGTPLGLILYDDF
ncbi:MAG: DUF4397 domain-containing protein [Pseudomonadota bacterium]